MFTNRGQMIRVIRSAMFAGFMIMMFTNCGQLASFNGADSANHFAANPVFPDQVPGGGLTPDDNGPIVVTPTTPPGGNPPTPVVTPTPTGPAGPTVGGNQPTPPQPPFLWCGPNNDQFQILRDDGTYTRCRPCVTPGETVIGDQTVPVCQVQRCDREDWYIIFGTDVNNPQDGCARCDVLNSTRTSCQTAVLPPPPAPAPVPTSTPSTTSTPTPTPTATPRPTTTRVTRRSPWGNEDRGGDGGGGDPLMIDTVGVEYADLDQLRNCLADQEGCSYFKSGEFDLTSREEGTRFNIFGQKTFTQLDNGDFMIITKPNYQFQISWIKPDQKRYQFLALPDANGNITGIDQLFGDNTYGPEGQFAHFATDGFQALMKHDLNENLDNRPDGYIDRRDAVFERLRVWHDENGDGNVDTAAERRDELKTLAEVKISYIHLLANERFFETDDHGNFIAYKSIVSFETEDPEAWHFGTAFDLWFFYQARDVVSEGAGYVLENNEDTPMM